MTLRCMEYAVKNIITAPKNLQAVVPVQLHLATLPNWVTERQYNSQTNSSYQIYVIVKLPSGCWSSLKNPFVPGIISFTSLLWARMINADRVQVAVQIGAHQSA